MSEEKAYPVPEWLKRGRVRWAGGLHNQANWARREGSPVIFYPRSARWYESWHKRVHTEAEVRKLAEAGVNCLTVHFWSGFGLESDREEIELTRELVSHCRTHGIRTLGYIQFQSVMEETFFLERPDARNWLQIDEEGKRRHWGNLYFRPTPCPNNPGYLSYLKEAIGFGLQELKLDGIRLDNNYFLGCYCGVCQQKFRHYLRARYDTPEKVRERFGLPFLDGVSIPRGGSAYDPLRQEWGRFRCESLAEAHRELYLHIKSVDPQAGFGGNPAYPRDNNWIWDRSLDLVALGRWMDILEIENRHFPQVLGDGRLISQVQGYKTGNAIGCIVKPAQWLMIEGHHAPPTEGHQAKLALCEAGAFGGHFTGAIWAMRPYENGTRNYYEKPELYEPWVRYNRFFADHEELYTDAEPAANVALLYAQDALALDFDRVYGSILGFQQVLIQRQIPFEIIFADQLNRLNAFDVLILANQTCLSDDACDAIRAFVEEGGGLVLTGDSALYDENRVLREESALADLVGHDRVVYLPDAPERVSFSTTDQAQARLPERPDDLAAAVQDAAPRGLPVSVKASEYTAVDVYRLPSGAQTIHLLNYRNTEPLRDVELVLSETFWQEGTFRLYDPDLEEPIDLAPERIAEGLRIRVPQLNTYAVIVASGDA